MKLQEYEKRYHIFLAAMHQTRLLKTVDVLLLDEFPSRLPDFVRDHFSQEIAGMQKALDEISVQGVEISSEGDSIPMLTVLALMSLRGAGYEVTEIDLEQTVLAQCLVMTIAYLEAFFVDTVYAICKAKPEVMKSQERSIDWRTVIDTGNFDELITFLAELYSRSLFEGVTVSESITVLRKRFGLDIDFPESSLILLDEARALRHAIVHNGGRADSKYLRLTKRADLILGQHINIALDWLNNISDLAYDLAGKVFLVTATKFFNATPESLRLIPVICA